MVLFWKMIFAIMGVHPSPGEGKDVTARFNMFLLHICGNNIKRNFFPNTSDIHVYHLQCNVATGHLVNSKKKLFIIRSICGYWICFNVDVFSSYQVQITGTCW